MTPARPGPARPVAPAGRPGRALRSAVFALISLALALAAHVVGGGRAPAGSVLGAALLALAGLGWLLSRRERGGRQLAALVVGTQALLHLAFVLPALLAARGAPGRAATAFAELLFCHSGRHTLSAAQLRAATRGLGFSPPAPGLLAVAGHVMPMLLAHLLAAGAVAWWLRRAERAVWAAARRVLRRLRMVAWRVPSNGPVPVPVAGRWAVAASRPAGTLSDRGPPAWPSFALPA